MRRWGLRFFIFLLIFVGILVLLTSTITYLYKDDVSKMVQDRLRKNLNVNLKIANTRFNYFTKWGELTLTFEGFSLENKFALGQTPLASLGSLHFSLNISELWSRNYVINKIYLEDGEINFLINQQGKANYDSLWNSFSLTNQKEFKLQNLVLNNVKISYQNQIQSEKYSLIAKSIKGKFDTPNYLNDIALEGDLSDFQFQAGEQKVIEPKEVSLSGVVGYQRANQRWQLNFPKISLQSTEFVLRGFYEFRTADDYVDLQIKGANGDLKPLWAFLPNQYAENLQGFKSKGNIQFDGSIKGEWGKAKYPQIEVDFGCLGASILSPHTTRQVIENLSFSGKFSNGEKTALETSSIRIKNISGTLAKQKFKANVYLVNFRQPYLVFDTEAGIDLGAWLEYYPLAKIDKAGGLLGIKLNFDAELAQLTQETLDKKMIVSGKLELLNASFQFKNNPLIYRNLNAHLVLTNNQAEIKNLSGNAGASDFLHQGAAYNLLPFWFVENQELYLKGSLQAKKLDLEDWLSKAYRGFDSSSPEVEKFDYTFIAPANLHFNLTCQVDSLNFRQFKARQLTADLWYKDKIAKTGNLSLQIAGGTLNVLGILNAQKENFITFDGRTILKNLQTDRFLASFENFSQKFIQDRHLKGVLEADVRSSWVFDKHWRVNFPSVSADMDMQITNGELKDFNLWEDLARKIEEKSSNRLIFKELKSILQIRNKTVFVPEIEIVSPSNPLSIIGRSTTDKGLDYKLKVSTIGKPFNPKASALFQRGKLVYYLTVKGTPDNYRIDYTEIPDKNKNKLESYWLQEKQGYLKLFNRTSLTATQFKIDTLKIVNFP
ncbi:MAG: AsmA family protein [Microscillaceae bacterium]|jgi:hypothetical protein|nr:AsmA family protein [Microscillaceae bacterium]